MGNVKREHDYRRRADCSGITEQTLLIGLSVCPELSFLREQKKNPGSPPSVADSLRVPTLPDNLSRASLGQSHRICKFSYRAIGSSRLDCSDEMRHPTHLVPRKDETGTKEIRYGTMNAYEGMNDDKLDECLQTDEGQTTLHSMRE
ncbi:hypothetical protein EVAR_15884_1 [Eumeta japonica]|uniref:Uncharacterized protein n=1 Tax=Eumeta variegata TaxID=151549 RepID=A0A4C1UE79_EUMVA|nr:hypothetical protein EVAR_15884_1 [Eumeta japonica]